MKFSRLRLKIVQHWAKIACFLLGAVFGGGIFLLLFPFQEKAVDESLKKGKDFQVRQKGNYQFISPLIECEIENAEVSKKYIPFEKKTKELIAKEIIEKNPNIHLAIYFRNLNNGPWFGINERENFTPASMLKVVLMMSFFKLSESDSSLLSKEVRFDRLNDSLGLVQNFKPKEQIAVGNKYTIEELIRRMIVFSDNQAMELLLKNIDEKQISRIYLDLGIEVPGLRNADDFMSVKEYASFFRILYNASYLNHQNSEKALELLAQVDYKNGIMKKLPSEIVVAHKFGEREFEENGKVVRQLHDCGVVYYEKYPYLLCVMTRGAEWDKLSAIVNDTSKIIFDEIKKNFP